MLIFSSISRGLEVWSVNRPSTYENSEWNAFKSIKFLGEISDNLPSDLLGTNIYKALEFHSQLSWTLLQCTNTTSVISKLGKFSPSLFLVILLLVLPSNFIVSGVKSLKYYLAFTLKVVLLSVLFMCTIIERLSVTVSCFLKIYLK